MYKLIYIGFFYLVMTDLIRHDNYQNNGLSTFSFNKARSIT